MHPDTTLGASISIKITAFRKIPAYSLQFRISVSNIAEAPSASSLSMISMERFLGIITFTAHQAGSSSALTVGDSLDNKDRYR